MAYGTNLIVTYGMRSLPYGIIGGGPQSNVLGYWNTGMLARPGAIRR